MIDAEGKETAPWFRETELFTGGSGGYNTYRIPAVVVANDGTILAFIEGRRTGPFDWGEINIVLRRSTDNGATWGAQEVVAADGENTIGNPCAVVDRETGTVWLAFCRNNDEVYVTSSADSGASWSKPREITAQVKAPSWTWYATGPGHGIQTSSGRLVVPCDHSEGTRHHSVFMHSHAIYSDDHGESWKHGDSLDEGSDECQMVETGDGGLYMTVRNGWLKKRRGAWSKDGGATWSALETRDDLPDPICEASIVRFTDRDSHDRDRVLFSNPASSIRERMTVRLSYDECRTWAVSKALYPGPSSYSDMAIASDMTICCLYERGVDDYRSGIDKNRFPESARFAQFNLEWLTEGADSVALK